MDSEPKDNPEVELKPENPEEKPQDPPVDPPKEDKPDESKDIDFKQELDKLEKTNTRTELDKAEFTAEKVLQRISELGGDPTKVATKFVKEKPKEEIKEFATLQDLDIKLAEQEVRKLAKSDDEFKVIMWWIKNKNLSVEDAHLIANKGKLKTSLDEVIRGKVIPRTISTGPGQRIAAEKVPERSVEEQKVLERRGLRFNPKTQTYQGRFTEEYYDTTDKKWKSRRLR